MRKGVDFCDISTASSCGMWSGMHIFFHVNLLEKATISLAKMMLRLSLYIFSSSRDSRKFSTLTELTSPMLPLSLYFERSILSGVKSEAKKWKSSALTFILISCVATRKSKLSPFILPSLPLLRLCMIFSSQYFPKSSMKYFLELVERVMCALFSLWSSWKNTPKKTKLVILFKNGQTHV